VYRIVLLQVWRFQQGDNGRGVGGSTHPRPCPQTLIFEWKSALYFNLWAKVQTFRHLTSAPVLLGQFSHCFFSEPLNTSGIWKMTWLHTSRNPPPPFGTVFPHLYTLLTVSLVLARSSRLICSQDICSRSVTPRMSRYRLPPDYQCVPRWRDSWHWCGVALDRDRQHQDWVHRRNMCTLYADVIELWGRWCQPSIGRYGDASRTRNIRLWNQFSASYTYVIVLPAPSSSTGKTRDDMPNNIQRCTVLPMLNSLISRLKLSKLTFWRPLLPCGYLVKSSFVIFDIRALWRSGLSVRVPGCKKITNDGLTRSDTGCLI